MAGVVHPGWLRVGAGHVTIEILARPGSPRRGIVRTEPRGIVIGIGAPAEKGKANDELVAIIAGLAKVPRSAVSITRGAGARSKVLKIAATDPNSLARTLEMALAEYER